MEKDVDLVAVQRDILRMSHGGLYFQCCCSMYKTRYIMSKAPIRSSIESKLTAAFNPIRLVIDDQSHMHRGHAGVADAVQAETHFSVEIVSNHFKSMNRVQRQREVNKVLDEEFKNGLHALALSCKVPEDL